MRNLHRQNVNAVAGSAGGPASGLGADSRQIPRTTGEASPVRPAPSLGATVPGGHIAFPGCNSCRIRPHTARIPGPATGVARAAGSATIPGSATVPGPAAGDCQGRRVRDGPGVRDHPRVRDPPPGPRRARGRPLGIATAPGGSATVPGPGSATAPEDPQRTRGTRPPQGTQPSAPPSPVSRTTMGRSCVPGSPVRGSWLPSSSCS